MEEEIVKEEEKPVFLRQVEVIVLEDTEENE